MEGHGSRHKRIRAAFWLRKGARGIGVVVVILLTVATAFVAYALQYPATFRFVRVPNPLSGNNPTYPLIAAPVPAVGAAFFDSRFKTIQTRVTQTDQINSRHEYSRFDPFNVDQSMILLLDTNGGYDIYRTRTMPYNQAANFVRYISLSEARWDLTNPRLLWALEDYSIVTLDVVSNTKTVIKNFAADATIGPIISFNPCYRITTREEGEASLDKRYWALLLQGDDRADYQALYLFTWDRLQNGVLGVRPLTGSDRDVDWVGMSVLGNWVLMGADPAGTGPIRGLTMADKALTQLHVLGTAIGHCDVGLDVNGREVVVGQNANTDFIDLIPIAWNTRPVNSPSGYAGSGTTPLIRLFYDNGSSYGLSSGIHVSCNYPGYAVVSTYIAPGLQDRNWLDRTVTLVRLDRASPNVYYLAKLHNTTQEEPRAYWEETHASITNDGKRIVWADNWGQNLGQEQMFLMQLDMPPNWTCFLVASARLWEFYR